jgi:hypothetical protein
MKLSLAFTALAAAADSEAPVISLDLVAHPNGQHPNSATYAKAMMASRRNHAKYGATVHSFNRAGYDHAAEPAGQPEATTAGSQNSFADECEVMENFPAPAGGTSCVLPVASAYDHHDGDITDSITTAYTLFVQSDPQQDSNNANADKVAPAGGIAQEMFTQRGEWVITYDVKDESGNMAEQVQFALIMIDEQVPKFTNSPFKLASSGYRTIKDQSTDAADSEANTANVDIELCNLETDGVQDAADDFKYQWIVRGTKLLAADNYDTDGFKARTQVPALPLLDQDNSAMNAVVTCDTSTAPCTSLSTATDGVGVYTINQADYTPATKGVVDTAARTAAMVQTYSLTTADFADIFGDDNQNNVYTETGTITLADTTKPTIVTTWPAEGDMSGSATEWECGYLPDPTSYRRPKGLAYDDCYDDYTQVYRPARIGITCQYSEGESQYQDITNQMIDAWGGFDGAVEDTYAYTEHAKKCFGSTSIGNGGDNAAANAHESAEEFGWKHHSKEQTIKLTYTVVDRFGNAAANTGVLTEISLVDNIAPTLYITRAQITASEQNPGTTSSEFCRNSTAAEYSNAAGSATDSSGATRVNPVDYTQAHCVFAHRGTDAQGSDDTTGTNHREGYHASYVHIDGDTNDASNSKVYHVQNGDSKLLGATGQDYTDETIIQHSAGYAADYTFVQELMEEHKGYACYDACSMTTTTVTWSEEGCAAAPDNGASEEFNMLKPGTYYLKYACNDHSDHTTTACRTFINVDKTRPVITILQYANHNDGTWHVEASRDNNYVDAGATCSDMVDGNISQDVEVSGDVVNMAAVGTYRINYNCEDSAGQTAIPATRTVVVEDSTCPTCTIPGGLNTITVEASFPYTDEASTCTDTLDGAMPDAHVYGTVDVEKTGEYVLTYSVTDKNGNCGDKNCRTASEAAANDFAPSQPAVHFTKTIIVEDTMVPIITVKYRGQALVGGSLMAERTTAINGWVIGALASAVSGIALLGYAATRKTASTSVPV